MRHSTDDTKHTNPKDIVGTKKAPMSTVSAPVMAEVGVAMLEGALKYGRHNYRAVGVRASVYYDAQDRHMNAWWEGEDLDPDSRMSHITKAIASLVVLRDAMIRGKMIDDRPPTTIGFYDELNKHAAELIDRYGDRDVKHYTKDDDQEPDSVVRISSGVFSSCATVPHDPSKMVCAEPGEGLSLHPPRDYIREYERMLNYEAMMADTKD